MLNSLEETVNQLINLYNQGQMASVIEQTGAVIEQYPGEPVLWNILGASKAQTGELHGAIDAYKKSVSLNPNYAEAYSNLGVALRNSGKLDEAVEAYKKSISLRPDYAEAYNNMGIVLKDQDKLEEAIEAYKKSISFKPDYAEAYDNMGVALKKQGDLDKAIEFYKKSISLKPVHAKGYYNMGNALRDQLKLDEAIEYYSKSISLNPNYVEAYNNLSLALQYQGKLEMAVEFYKKSISLNPEYSETHKNLGLSLLRIGKLKEGFDEMEWRLKNPQILSDYQHRNYSQPKWDGKTSLSGKRILIWCEQGIGDTLNWSSLLPLVTNHAAHCILECQEKLVPLLKRSFPNIEVKPEDKRRDIKRDDFDFHLPMGSLYKHFLEEITQSPKPESYLVPDPIRVDYWKERLKSLGKGPYIGICWKSSIVSSYRLLHYPNISTWSPILSIADVTFINLQYEDFADDLVKVKDELGVTVHNFDDLDQFNNIDDVTALCAALDMAVTTKVTPMILSSGVGKITKIANLKQSIWDNILFNPVSATVEMYYKNTWEAWDNVFSLIARDICETIKK